MERDMSFTSRDVKKFILDTSCDLEEIVNYLEVDCQATIEGIFTGIFSLLRHYRQNASRVDYLLLFLEEYVGMATSEELQKIVGPIVDFNNKISAWKLKDRILVHDPYLRIQNLFNQVNQNLIMDVHNEKIKYLSFLIFQEQNLAMIDHFLSENSGILNSRNADGDNIFGILLKKYLYLDEGDYEEIAYLYRVILLFVNSRHEKDIYKNRDRYLKIIKQSKLGYKEHIIHVIELFDPDFRISLTDLEERYHVLFEFPEVILNEMNTFRMNNRDRYSFLEQKCVTIDGRGTTCLDDALYIEKNEDGSYYLYVHIADIPAFVPKGSIMDMEAMRRGETLYLRDRNILMYPDYISNGICSLFPDNHRNVVSYIFHLDSDYRLIEGDFTVVKGKIQVAKRMCYEEVDRLLKDDLDDDLSLMLRHLANFASVRRKENKKKEDYRKYQNAILFDPNHESLKIDYSMSANIVHEAMVLVNYQSGKFAKDHGYPYLYRSLELPSDDFIEKQLLKLSKLDSKLVSSKEFLYKLRESYAKSQYIDRPVYHRGLNLECYSHSSSPDRRYSDAFNQYILYDLVFDGNREDQNIYSWEYCVKRLAVDLNQRDIENEVFISHYNYLSYRDLIRVKKK